MIVKTYKTLKYPLQIRLLLKTNSPRRVGIIARDVDNPETVYMQRWNTINGRQELFILLPQSPNEIKVEIFNISKDRNNKGLILLEMQPMSLNYNIDLIGINDKSTLSFVKLAQEFAEKAKYLSPGFYLSDDGKFVISYLETILSNTGAELSTPARINIKTGQIQVSKKNIKKYTVPGIVAILFHEYSHVYKNIKPSDEVEADLNGARIYLGLGYPRIELLNAWANVFYRADTPGNRDRWNQVKNYVLNFDMK